MPAGSISPVRTRDLRIADPTEFCPASAMHLSIALLQSRQGMQAFHHRKRDRAVERKTIAGFIIVPLLEASQGGGCC